MKLSNKHLNPSTIIRADFSGGLNLTANVDGILENQLADALNVEVEHNTGRLKTVAGTSDVWQTDKKIFAAMYDEINKKILVVTDDKNVYIANSWKRLGSLTGSLYPICTSWEDGLLISSGDKLQYFNGEKLLTLTSPSCSSVYIRAGRVLLTDEKNVRYSGVGDETNWMEDTNDDSSSKWIEAGYKDGGKFLGMANLSQDILLIKDNHRVYRLSGEFPNWSIAEVSRNVECSGRLSFCTVADSVFILGKNEVQVIQTTQSYGDVKPENVASLVVSEVQKLPTDALMRYVPPLNQIWCIGRDGKILFYDLSTKSWFRRQFNSKIIDVISVGDEVFVIKPDRISKLDENTFYDSGEPLRWQFKAQRLVSQHEYLLKRTQISIIPFSSLLYSGQINVGGVCVPFPIPMRNIRIYKNFSPVYKNHTKICLTARMTFTYMKGELIYNNLTPIYGNTEKIFSRPTFIKESRNVFRSRFIDVFGRGSCGGFLLNGIILEVAEV